MPAGRACSSRQRTMTASARTRAWMSAAEIRVGPVTLRVIGSQLTGEARRRSPTSIARFTSTCSSTSCGPNGARGPPRRRGLGGGHRRPRMGDRPPRADHPASSRRRWPDARRVSRGLRDQRRPHRRSALGHPLSAAAVLSCHAIPIVIADLLRTDRRGRRRVTARRDPWH